MIDYDLQFYSTFFFNLVPRNAVNANVTLSGDLLCSSVDVYILIMPVDGKLNFIN